jgi:GNAT superfamily N-acetyltransferase
MESAGHILKYADSPGGIDVVRNIGESLTKKAEDWTKTSPILQPSREEKESYLRRSVTGTLESAPLSLGPSLGGAAAGAAIGSAVGPVGTIVGGLAGGAISTLGAFYASSFNKTYEDAIKAGKSEEEAKSLGRKIGLIEGGIEFLTTPVELMTAGFGKVATQPIKNTIKQILKTPAKQFLKNFVQTAAVETGTEGLQNYWEASVLQNAGMETPPPMEALIESIGPSLGMTMLFTMGAHGLNKHRTSNLKNNLSNPDTDIGKRQDAAIEVGRYIQENQKDPELTAQWLKKTDEAIKAKQPIPIDADIQEWTTKKIETDVAQEPPPEAPEAAVQPGEPEGPAGEEVTVPIFPPKAEVGEAKPIPGPSDILFEWTKKKPSRILDPEKYSPEIVAETFGISVDLAKTALNEAKGKLVADIEKKIKNLERHPDVKNRAENRDQEGRASKPLNNYIRLLNQYSQLTGGIYDRKGEVGIPGEIGGRKEEPGRAVQEPEGGGETVKTGGVFQKQEEGGLVAPPKVTVPRSGGTVETVAGPVAGEETGYVPSRIAEYKPSLKPAPVNMIRREDGKTYVAKPEEQAIAKDHAAEAKRLGLVFNGLNPDGSAQFTDKETGKAFVAEPGQVETALKQTKEPAPAVELPPPQPEGPPGPLTPASIPFQPAPGGPTKQPWEMTKKEYLGLFKDDEKAEVLEDNVADIDYYPPEEVHRNIVKEAIERDKPIPPEVLAEYPELKAPVPPASKERRPETPSKLDWTFSVDVFKDKVWDSDDNKWQIVERKGTGKPFNVRRKDKHGEWVTLDSFVSLSVAKKSIEAEREAGEPSLKNTHIYGDSFIETPEAQPPAPKSVEREPAKPTEALPPHKIITDRSGIYKNWRLATVTEGPHKGVIAYGRDDADAEKVLRVAIKGREKKEAPPVEAPKEKRLIVKAVKTPGGVTRLIYMNKNFIVGTARMMGQTIGDIQVNKKFQRQGFGSEMVQDLVERGGRSATTVNEASKGLFAKAGFVEDSPSHFVLNESGRTAVEEGIEKKPARLIPETDFGKELLNMWDSAKKGEEAPQNVDRLIYTASDEKIEEAYNDKGLIAPLVELVNQARATRKIAEKETVSAGEVVEEKPAKELEKKTAAIDITADMIPEGKTIKVTRIENGKRYSVEISAQEGLQELKDNEITIKRLNDLLGCLG